MAAFTITVSDPETRSDTLGSYVLYRINSSGGGTDTTTSMPVTNATVLRRYSDFLWLHGELEFAFPGAIVPPLPEKNVVRRFSTEFIEARRRALERFLNRVAMHADLCPSPVFRNFLLATDDGLAAAKEEARNQRKQQGGTKFMQWMEGAVSSLSAGGGAARDEAQSPVDARFEEEAQFIQNLEAQMQNVVKHTAMLVKRNREVANALFEFGMAFTLLGQTEADSLGGALAQLGRNADQMSVAAAEHAENEATQFEEPLQEYTRMIGAVKVALQRRAERKAAYQSALADLEAKQAAHQRISQTPGKEDKAESARQAAERAQESSDKAKADFDEVSERVLRELDRWKREKAADMRRYMLDFAQLQAQYNRQLEENWRSLVPRLQAVQGETRQDGLYAAAPVPAPAPAPGADDVPDAPSGTAAPAASNADGELVGV